MNRGNWVDYGECCVVLSEWAIDGYVQSGKAKTDRWPMQHADFDVVRRGYDIHQVDNFLTSMQQQASGSAQQRIEELEVLDLCRTPLAAGLGGLHRLLVEINHHERGQLQYVQHRNTVGW